MTKWHRFFKPIAYISVVIKNQTKYELHSTVNTLTDGLSILQDIDLRNAENKQAFFVLYFLTIHSFLAMA